MIEEAPEPLARYQPRMSYFFIDERRAQFELTEDVRNTVAGLLALEFGPLDEATEARLEKASSTQLGAWAERVLTAGKLEEIWS